MMTVKEEVLHYMIQHTIVSEKDKAFSVNEVSKGIGRTYLQVRKVMLDMANESRDPLVYGVRKKKGGHVNFFVDGNVVNDEVLLFLQRLK